jgi:hypothetical protein
MTSNQTQNQTAYPSGVEVARALLARLDEKGAIPRGRLKHHKLWERLAVPRSRRTAHKGRTI